MKHVKFLSIDASITCTGLAILELTENKKFKLIDKTSIKIKTIYNDRFKKKLDMAELFKYWVDLKSKDISFAVFENYSYGSSGHLADLGELNGLFKNILYSHNIPVDVISPASVKKLVTGSGKATKEEVQSSLANHIINLDSFTFNNLDESDAVGVGIAYALNMLSLIEKKDEPRESEKKVVRRSRSKSKRDAD